MTYALGATLRAGRPSAWLFEAPDAAARVSSELIFGETVTLLEEKSGWYCLKTARDAYQGWARQEVLALPADAAPTHLVTSKSALVYVDPDFHGAPYQSLPMNAQLHICGDEENGFLNRVDGGYICKQHVARATIHSSPLDVAKRFIGTPYAWGGRTWRGIDCSGIIQQSLWACGRDCPRDSGDQWEKLGRQLTDDETPQEGDIVFFPGHVGFYLDGGYLLHANATHMACTIDPLTDVIGWVAKDHPDQPLKGFKRL